MKIPREKVLAARQDIEAIGRAQNRLSRLVRLFDVTGIAKINYSGEELIPRDEPVAILASHQNSFDAHSLGYFYYRTTGLPLSVLAKKELETIPIIGSMLRNIGAIAINRDGTSSNREALVTAMARLQAGGSLAVFGEEKRTYEGIIGPISKTVINIAKKAHVPLVTIGIYGPSPASPFTPRPVTLHVGSITNPGDISDSADFYRQQLQQDYEKALLSHSDWAA